MTSEDIKHLLDTNPDMYDEIHKYYKTKEKQREITQLINTIRGNTKNPSKNIDKYYDLINSLEISNSNFDANGCKHEIKFNIDKMQVLYTISNFDTRRTRPPEPIRVIIDKQYIIEMSMEFCHTFSEIKSFYNGNYDKIADYCGYREESLNEALCHESKVEFNKISKHHFPDENPSVIFNLICDILSYYHDKY